MQKRYVVTLTAEEREELGRLISRGKAAARKLTRARILLLADQAEGGPAKSDPEIVEAVVCGRATVERVRKQFVEEGLEHTLTRKPTVRTYENKLDGRTEAHLIAITCGAPPDGQARWTLRLLADRMVALGHVESVSHETVRMTLKKTTSNRGSRKAGVCPKLPTANSSLRGKTCWTSTTGRLTRSIRWCVWMKRANS